jgi:hypothetical protein
MGGSKEDKVASKLRISQQALEHDSDLLYQVSVSDEWFNSGEVDNDGLCRSCQKKCTNKSKGCKVCRVKYSMANSLNNKVLDVSLTTQVDVMKIICSYSTLLNLKRWLEFDNFSEDEKALYSSEEYQMERIAFCLENSFPDQMGVFLVSSLPSEGARMLHSDVRARITQTSSLAQRSRKDTFACFIAMSITQLPSGMYVVDKIHPLLRQIDHSEEKFGLLPKPVKEWGNVSEKISSDVRKFIQSANDSSDSNSASTSWSKFSAISYDSSSCKLTLHCPLNEKESAVNAIGNKINQLIDEFLAYESEEKLTGGSGSLKLKSGMDVLSIEPIGSCQRLTLKLPKRDEDWKSSIKEHSTWNLESSLHRSNTKASNFSIKIQERLWINSGACNYYIEILSLF